MKRMGTGIASKGRRRRRKTASLRPSLLLSLCAVLLLLPASSALAAPPAVSEIEASQVHATTARLQGLVNPEGAPTTYQFQYLSLAQWEANGFEGATAQPTTPASIGAGTTNIAVAEKLTGLDPDTAYRFRLLAVAKEGTPEEEFTEEEATFATYRLPQVFGSCPNESLRYGAGANLPDCRAYEQASPVDKNGGNVGASVELTKASLNGDGITFESQAGVPGGDGSQAFPIYMASREGGAWVTRGLLPPASENENGNVLGWTPDFAWTFDLGSRKLAGAQALLARPRHSNPLTALAPYTSPGPGYFLGGASADDSKVIFAATGALPVKAGDPAPAAGKQNVYAWDREGEELSLAGVLPNGSVPAKGTGLTGGYMQDMHVIAADGSVFFLDNSTGKLYLRLHPTEPETIAKDGKGNCVPDPVLACTLAVSASHRTPPDPESFVPIFRSASADGSAAFFTSKEELTQNADTKAPPNVIGRADISGSEAADVQGNFITGPNVTGLSASADHLYWVNSATNTIGRSKPDGKEEEPACVALPQVEVEAGKFAPANPQDIVVGKGVDEGHLYWTNATDKAAGHGTIGRADISASSTCAEIQASVNEKFITGATNPLGIDTDGSYVYWCNTGAQPTRAIGRAGIDGSGVNQKFADEGDIFRPQDVAADPAHNHLYVARGMGSVIARLKLDEPSNEPIFLPVAASYAQRITTDGNRLYWTYAITEAGKTENIYRSNLNGEEVEADFIAAQEPAGIALGRDTDSNHLYWGAHPTGRGEDLYRFDAETGELTDLAVPPRSTHGADVQGLLGTSTDGTRVYFVANGGFNGASEGSCNGESGVCNLYVWHEEDPETHAGSIALVSRLKGSGEDPANWVTKSNVELGLRQKVSRVSADGRTLLFRSARRLTSYDNNGPCGGLGGLGGAQAPCAELYRWQVGDSAPTCVSCDPTGAPPLGPATLGTIEPGFVGAAIQMDLLSRNLSADGSQVFFETRDPLVAADVNADEGCPGWGSGSQGQRIKACQDVYEWEAPDTGSCESEAQDGGCLYLLSTGKSDQASFFADADESGDNAFIFTASRLVGQDEDGLFDVYDARVRGGLDSQVKTEEPSCEGEACQGTTASPPAAQTPGSAGFAGEGNQAPERHNHKKKKHAKKHRKHKHTKRHRNAHKSGGAGR